MGDEGDLGTFPIHPALHNIYIQTSRNGSLQYAPDARAYLPSRPLVPLWARHDLLCPSLSGSFSHTNVCQFGNFSLLPRGPKLGHDGGSSPTLCGW